MFILLFHDDHMYYMYIIIIYCFRQSKVDILFVHVQNMNTLFLNQQLLQHCHYQLSPDPPRGSKSTNSRAQANGRRIAHNLMQCNFKAVKSV